MRSANASSQRLIRWRIVEALIYIGFFVASLQSKLRATNQCLCEARMLSHNQFVSLRLARCANWAMNLRPERHLPYILSIIIFTLADCCEHRVMTSFDGFYKQRSVRFDENRCRSESPSDCHKMPWTKVSAFDGHSHIVSSSLFHCCFILNQHLHHHQQL